MLYCPVGLSKPVRVKGCYVSDDEIEHVIEFVTSQGDVMYDDAVMQEIELKAAQDGKKKTSATVDKPTFLFGSSSSSVPVFKIAYSNSILVPNLVTLPST